MKYALVYTFWSFANWNCMYHKTPKPAQLLSIMNSGLKHKPRTFQNF